MTPEEQQLLAQLSRALTAPAAEVTRAKLFLAVARDAVSQLVARFNAEGLAALTPRHGGRSPGYDQATAGRILGELKRTPTPEADGTATWSLSTLRTALRTVPDGLPAISTYTLWRVLHEAGYSHQHTRSWCPTGAAVVTDPDTTPPPKKKLIEDAYRLSEAMGLSVWCADQAGPFPTIPSPGSPGVPRASRCGSRTNTSATARPRS